MRLGTGAKVLLGLATAWPLVYMVVFMATIFYNVFWGSFAAGSTEPQAGPPRWFLLLFAGHFFTMFLIFALLVIYGLHLFKTDRITQDKKALWAVVLFLGNMLAMPVYFYLYVWKEPTTPRAT